MVMRLGPTTPTAELAGQLNAAGLTTGTGAPFDVKAVQWIRHAYHVPAPNPYADGEISVAEAAARLGTSIGVVYDWIKTGKLDARRGPGIHARRRADVVSRTVSVDLLNRSLLTGLLPVQLLRAGGLQALASAPPLRNLLMREGLRPGAALEEIGRTLRDALPRFSRRA